MKKNANKKNFIRSHMIEIILSIPKTIYFNLKVLPFLKAIKFPFIISYHIKLKGINRRTFIVEAENDTFACSRIGFEYTAESYRDNKKGIISIENGKIIVLGNVGISQGIILYAKNCNIVLGNNFRCNYSTTISGRNDDIVIGDNVVFGWNIVVKSDDGHYIVEDNSIRNNSADIKIGNNVWICSDSTILKGTVIGDFCVVAYGSLVNKAYEECNQLIGGHPAKIIKTNISWRE